MRVKANTFRASQPRIKVVMVKQGDIYITHIYRSRDCFRLDELARYKRKAFKTLEATTSGVNCKRKERDECE